MNFYRALLPFVLLVAILVASPFFSIAQAQTTSEAATNETLEPEDENDLSGFGEEGDLSGFEGEDGSNFGEEAGFEDIEIKLDDIELASTDESAATFGGFVKEEVDYSHAYDDPDFSKIKSTLNLNLDWKIASDWKAKINWNGFYDYSYSYRGRDEFTDETLETYESESEFREVYVDGGINNWFRIKIGRQFIAWGQSESSQITDVANPRDLREIGMVDLEDSRVPVAATKLSFLFGSVELNAVAIHEIRGNKVPSVGSEFDLLQNIRGPGVVIEEEEIPESKAENTEYLVRLFKTFNGGDFGVMWADIYDDYAHMEFRELVVNLPNYVLTLVPQHKRIKTYGFSANMVSDSWLFKTEMARKLGVAVARKDTEAQLKVVAGAGNATYNEDTQIIKTWSEKNTYSGMIGVEYSGIQDMTISVEAVGERIEEYEENLSSKETTAQAVLIVSYSALHDTFDSQLFWIHFTDNNGDVYRLNLEYDIIDALSVSGGFIAYEADDEDATVYNYRKNDRVFVSLKYSF